MPPPPPTIDRYPWLADIPPLGPVSRVVIVANGQLPSNRRMERALEDARTDDRALVLALDGAAYRLLGKGIAAELVVGDLDSFAGWESVPPKDRPDPLPPVVRLTDPTTSDLEKGLIIAAHLGARWVMATGVWSVDRPDHSLGAVLLLRAMHGWFDRLALVGDEWSMHWIVGGQARKFETFPGQRLSLLPAGPEGSKVSVEGVKWPVDNEPLPSGTAGLSNLATGSSVRVSVHEGGVLLVAFEQEFRELPPAGPPVP